MWDIKLAMHATTARFWDMHKGTFWDWEECRKMMVSWFEPLVQMHVKNFLGPGDPRKYLTSWME